MLANEFHSNGFRPRRPSLSQPVKRRLEARVGVGDIGTGSGVVVRPVDGRDRKTLALAVRKSSSSLGGGETFCNLPNAAELLRNGDERQCLVVEFDTRPVGFVAGADGPRSSWEIAFVACLHKSRAGLMEGNMLNVVGSYLAEMQAIDPVSYTHLTLPTTPYV